MPLFSSDSPFLHLPFRLDGKQKLFLDGMRHSAELADFAYDRLAATLATLAQNARVQQTRGEFTAAFLDAWAVVDGIDRFRTLLKLMPNLTLLPPADGKRTFEERMQVIRGLRNVADHLAQRADYVVAQRGTALGILSWLMPLSEDGTRGRTCVIVPGTLPEYSQPFVQPVGRTIERPCGQIHLKAGEHSASLSEAVRDTRQMVGHMEAALARTLAASMQSLESFGSDVMITFDFEVPANAFGSNGPERPGT